MVMLASSKWTRWARSPRVGRRVTGPIGGAFTMTIAGANLASPYETGLSKRSWIGQLAKNAGFSTGRGSSDGADWRRSGEPRLASAVTPPCHRHVHWVGLDRLGRPPRRGLVAPEGAAPFRRRR